MKKLMSLLLISLVVLSGCADLPILPEFDSERTYGSISTDDNTESITNEDDSTTDKTDAATADDTTESVTSDGATADGSTGELESVTSSGVFYPTLESDPYVNVDPEEFYANYTPAVNAADAYHRTKHYLMSGSIEAQDQDPTIAQDRPMQDGMYVRNTSSIFSATGDAYYVLDSEGEVANIIYRDGAYVTLEEVAAYLIAFGDVPPNYSKNKKDDPEDSDWGEYLRVNHSKFSGNTTKYPYEPELPSISGCGGDITYYELDIGTTGTDCDPSYLADVYNNGKRILRGAARIVYTRFDRNGDSIIDVNEKFVFYTNNHYNDFREYLNYEGGWGEIFGNVTGGGKLSSKTDYNPTPYVKTARADLSVKATYELCAPVWYYCEIKKTADLCGFFI